MRYISTRGHVAPIGFIDAILMGMADDGGLLVPEQIPQVTKQTLEQWRKLPYQELALEILTLYVNDEIPRADLKRMIDESYSTFRDGAITPVRRLDDNRYVLELFHGPTFAFKDVALQFLGNLYAYVAQRRDSVINILGATSGDTGASAIEGVRGKAGIRICILYPHQKVSRVQELQMTTVIEPNVLNLAVEGTFDDCQRIIKELFGDIDFKSEYHLRAINSINIARILAQTVYYFYAYLQLSGDGSTERIRFSVPTGNFGDIFAGYIAKEMGLPIDKLVLATNENNILARYVAEGVYEPGDFRKTYSPSMDIQVASNFERYLYYLHKENSEKVSSLMAVFRAEGRLVTEADALGQVQSDFAAHSVTNEECLAAITRYYEQYGYLLDPHTACAAVAADAFDSTAAADATTVILSTAHPAKFDEAIRLIQIRQEYPREIENLFEMKTDSTVVGSTVEEIRARLIDFLA